MKSLRNRLTVGIANAKLAFVPLQSLAKPSYNIHSLRPLKSGIHVYKIHAIYILDSTMQSIETYICRIKYHFQAKYVPK